jgi:hypothetical protein
MTIRLREMAARGYAGPAIAAALSAMQPADKAPLTAEAIRKKACSLGIALRPVRQPKQCRVEINHDTRAILATAAKARGVSVSRLARQILARVAFDNLFVAVLDIAGPGSGKTPMNGSPSFRAGGVGGRV